jgi:hypothetical protein
LTVLVGGCLGPVTPQQLQRRYADAAKLPAGEQRDQRLKWLALDAADANDAAVAEKAIGAIAHPRTRDDTAVASAARFAQSKAPDVAARVARLIGDPERRARATDEVMRSQNR